MASKTGSIKETTTAWIFSELDRYFKERGFTKWTYEDAAGLLKSSKCTVSRACRLLAFPRCDFLEKFRTAVTPDLDGDYVLGKMLRDWHRKYGRFPAWHGTPEYQAYCVEHSMSLDGIPIVVHEDLKEDQDNPIPIPVVPCRPEKSVCVDNNKEHINNFVSEMCRRIDGSDIMDLLYGNVSRETYEAFYKIDRLCYEDGINLRVVINSVVNAVSNDVLYGKKGDLV